MCAPSKLPNTVSPIAVSGPVPGGSSVATVGAASPPPGAGLFTLRPRVDIAAALLTTREDWTYQEQQNGNVSE